jgi:hypothetical protein
MVITSAHTSKAIVRRMRIKTRITILGIAGLAAVGVGLWAYQFHSKSERAVAKYKRQLVAAGEKLTIEECWPRLRPDERNGAGIFFQAQTHGLNRPGLLQSNAPAAMRMVGPGKAVIGWAQPNVRDTQTNSWEEIKATLSDKREAMEILEQLIEAPTLDFALDYSQGFNLLLPHLASCKQSSQVLSAGVVYDLHEHDLEAAVRKLRTMLALAKGMGHERLIISQLVRAAVVSIAMAANWELLQAKDLTDPQLASVQQDWLELDLRSGSENALIMERAMTELTLSRMRRSSAEFRRVATGWSGGGAGGGGGSGSWWQQAGMATLLKTKESMWQFAWAYPDELRALQGVEAIIKAGRQAQGPGGFKAALDQQEKRLAELGIHEKESDAETALFNLNDVDLRSLFTHSVLSLQRFLRRTMTAEAARQLTVTAIAIKRFELKHGHRPRDLGALTPEFLASIPRDPVNGESLHYTETSDGNFALYSVGTDGVDDGGNANPPGGESDPRANFSRSPHWQYGKDFVWPQPATAVELAAFEQKQFARRGSPVRVPLDSTNAPTTNAPN